MAMFLHPTQFSNLKENYGNNFQTLYNIMFYLVPVLKVSYYRGAGKSLARPGRKQATATKL